MSELMGLTEEVRSLNRQVGSLFSGYEFDLAELLELLLKGKITDATKLLFQNFGQMVTGEWKSMMQVVVLLLCLGILSALLMNLTELLESRQIADVGFYVVYLFLILILLKVFGMVSDMAQNLITDMLTFMKLFMPVYFMAVGVAKGVTTALLYYQFVLALIYGIEAALSAFVMPLIKAYIFLAIMNGLWMEERLHMLMELTKRIIGYLLKLSFAAVTGISLIQTMITPVIDSLRLSAVQKSISLIPGIGNIGEGVAEMMLGSAVLIKNSIGVLAVLLLILLCALPAAKIWILSMALKFAAALSNMLGDRRITGCMDRVGEGSLLVLRTLLTAGGLFLVTIAIAAMTTNGGI